MTAPFPLGSSVDYYIYGRDHKYGCRLVPWNEVQPGDIAIWSRDGNPLNGGGAGGHTAVVEAVLTPGHTYVTMESYGSHGVGRKTRTDFWQWFVRVDGINAQRVFQMSRLTDRCINKKIQYYSGGGDNDRDGVANRADLNNYMNPWAAIGVDCSGYVWAMFDCAWFFVPIYSSPITPGGDEDMTPEEHAWLLQVHEAIYKGETPSILRDINNMLHRFWDWNPLDPDSAAALKIKDIHGIAGAIRDGFSNNPATSSVAKLQHNIYAMRANIWKTLQAVSPNAKNPEN